MKSATAVHLRIHKHPTLPSPQRGGKGYHSRQEQTKHLRYPNRRAGACSRRRKEYPLRHGYPSLVGAGFPRPNATNPLSVTAMCHPEQAKRVEPQAKRRGGCRVSGRRDLSWSCGCFCLDPIFAVPARYPYRGSTTGVPPSAQDDTWTVHLRNRYRGGSKPPPYGWMG